MLPFLSSTRSLTFSGKRGSPPTFLPPFVHDFADRFPNVKRLSLSRISWGDRHPPHPTTFAMFSRFTSVQVLRLHHCSFPSFRALVLTLKGLPMLSELDMRSCAWPGSGPSSPPTQRPVRPRSWDKPALSYLWLEGGGTIDRCWTQLLDWLAWTPSRTHIRTLAVVSSGVIIEQPLQVSEPFQIFDFSSLSELTLSLQIQVCERQGVCGLTCICML